MRLRLIIYFAVIVLVTIISMLFFATLGLANEVRSYMFRGGMYKTSGIIEQLQNLYITNGSWQGAETFFHSPMQGRGWGNQGTGQMMGAMMRQHLILTDEDGRIIADSSDSNPSGKVDVRDLRTATPIEIENTTIGYLIAVDGMTFSTEDESFLVGRLTSAALTAGLIAGVISLVLALFLAYRLLRPVQALSQAAQQLGSGNLSQRAPILGNDELAELSRTFNLMASSLENAEQSRKAMTADIAHELRTPLAVQRANLEALQDGVFPLTTENLESILEQNLLLTRLVEDLNTLALVDSGKLELQRSATSFPELVKRVMDRYQSQAISAGIQLTLQFDPAQDEMILLSIDPLRIEQIIGNLLSNAFRYTPENGRIELRITSSKESVQLTVHDSGEGIPPEALPHIFERFYRADRSRSRALGGSGLGLAIARKLAEAHGGELNAGNHPAGGAVFTLILAKA